MVWLCDIWWWLLRFVEQPFEHVGRIPALGADHEGGDIGESGLQGDDHQVAHQADVLAARQISFGRFVEVDLGQLGFHLFEPIHLGFDRADRIEVLGELLPVGVAEIPLHRAARPRERGR